VFVIRGNNPAHPERRRAYIRFVGLVPWNPDVPHHLHKEKRRAIVLLYLPDVQNVVAQALELAEQFLHPCPHLVRTMVLLPECDQQE
jgi:hypothetical protein